MQQLQRLLLFKPAVRMFPRKNAVNSNNIHRSVQLSEITRNPEQHVRRYINSCMKFLLSPERVLVLHAQSFLEEYSINSTILLKEFFVHQNTASNFAIKMSHPMPYTLSM